MQDKISSMQFRVILSKLTGDQALADNILSKNMDNSIKLLLETADESIIHDCQVNISRKSNFADFWSVTEQKLESLHTAVINDHQHSKTVASDLVINMAHTV